MSDFHWVMIAVVTVMSAARVTRVVTYDSFPPVAWLRDRFIDWTDRTAASREWQLIAYCGYCASFWVTLSIVLWGYFTTWQLAWWILNGALGASYIAAIIMAHDGDNGDESVSGNSENVESK